MGVEVLKGGKKETGIQCLHVFYIVLGWIHYQYLLSLTLGHMSEYSWEISLSPLESQCSPHLHHSVSSWGGYYVESGFAKEKIDQRQEDLLAVAINHASRCEYVIVVIWKSLKIQETLKRQNWKVLVTESSEGIKQANSCSSNWVECSSLHETRKTKSC